MDDFLSVYGSTFGAAQMFDTQQIVVTLLMSFVLCSVFAVVYGWTFQGLSYSRGFVQTIILSGMVSSLLIMAIGNNLARGMGILGTLAVIRFRTQIRDPRDMVFLFASLGVGIACGANVFTVAIVGTLCFAAAILLLHWSPAASRRDYEGMLRFLRPAHTESDVDFQTLVHQTCATCHLIAMREAAQGDLLEYCYQVRLIDPSYSKDLLDGIKNLPGVADPSLLMQRTTVEL